MTKYQIVKIRHYPIGDETEILETVSGEKKAYARRRELANETWQTWIEIRVERDA